MKSAYELALERLESQGIERPRQEQMSDDVREEIAEIRRRAEAKLAELQIMHRDRMQKPGVDRAQEEEEYQSERRRIEEDRDRKIEQLRG